MRFTQIGHQLKHLAHHTPQRAEAVKQRLFEVLATIPDGPLAIETGEYWTAALWAILGFSMGIDTLRIKHRVREWWTQHHVEENLAT